MAVGLKPTNVSFFLCSVIFCGGRWGGVASSINSRENGNCSKYLPQFIHSLIKSIKSIIATLLPKKMNASFFFFLFSFFFLNLFNHHVTYVSFITNPDQSQCFFMGLFTLTLFYTWTQLFLFMVFSFFFFSFFLFS